jgi:hypothetical protein
MATLEESPTSVEVPDRPEQDWLHPTTTDWYYLGFALSMILVFTNLIPAVGVLAWMVVFVPGWIQLRDGRVYYVIGIKLRSVWIDRVLKGNLWEAYPEHPRRARLLRAPPPNERLAINVVQVDDYDEIALIYNRRAKTDTILIGGLGSDIAANPIVVQRMFNDRFAEGLKRIATVRSHDIMLTLINSRRPANVREAMDIYGANMHPAFLPHEPEGEPPWPAEEGMTEAEYAEFLAEQEADANIAAVLEECLFMARDDSNKNTMVMAITVRREALLHKLAGKGKSLADDDDERLLAAEIAKVSVEVLTNCGVEGAHVYSFEEVHEHLRYAWDVQQDDLYAGWKADNGGDREDPKFQYFHWPQDHIRATKGKSELDGSHHAVLRIEGSPKFAEPDTFRQLYAIDAPNVTVAHVGKTVRSSREVQGLEVAKPTLEVVSEKLGIIQETQRSLDRQARRAARLQTAYQARYTEYGNVIIVVSSTTGRQLERDVESALRSINRIDGVEVSRIEMSFLQVPWVFTAHGAPV